MRISDWSSDVCSSDLKTQELQLISNATSPGADWLQWIAGLYHIESGAGYPAVLFSVGRDLPFLESALGELQNPGNPLIGTDLADQLLSNLAGLGTKADILARGQLQVRSHAGHFQGPVRLPFNYSFTLGG